MAQLMYTRQDTSTWRGAIYDRFLHHRTLNSGEEGEGGVIGVVAYGERELHNCGQGGGRGVAYSERELHDGGQEERRRGHPLLNPAVVS